MSNLYKFLNQEKIHNYEGDRGIVNLCKIAAGLGYKDPMHYGQLERGAVLGDLLEFLRDNSGAIEAIVEWIESRESLWANELKSNLINNEETEDDE